MSVKESNEITVKISCSLEEMYNDLENKGFEIVDKYYIKHIILNLEHLGFMDSSGIGFIIGRYAQIKKRQGKIVIWSMNDIIERIFNLSGLKRICMVASSEEEAQSCLEVI